MINILKNINNNIIQYFCDSTFRIIPNKFISFKINKKNILSYNIKCRGYKCLSSGKIDLLTGIAVYLDKCKEEHLSCLKAKANFFMNNKILNYLSDNNITFQKYIVECLLNIYTDIYTTEDIRNKYHTLTGKYTDLNNTKLVK